MTPHPLLDEAEAVRALSALAQAQRLRAFRALVVAGEAGLTAGALAQALDIAPSALSFHLKELSHAGLVTGEPQGRFVIYRAAFEHMTALLAYLTEHCCQGEPCAVGPVSTAPCSTC
jgi:ArsR family transcriptional regulator, arsenate/arsenite/antimonite-responsive transcriptional repressor